MIQSMRREKQRKCLPCCGNHKRDVDHSRRIAQRVHPSILPLLRFSIVFLHLNPSISFVLIPTQVRQSGARGLILPAATQQGLKLNTDGDYDHVATTSSPALRRKEELLQILRDIPANTATSPSQTRQILSLVQQLERQQLQSPSNIDRETVLRQITGTWELLWTAQDPFAPESSRGLASWINPLENQSYSNNPTGGDSGRGGRANPILPLPIQNALERAGMVSYTSIKSTQVIDVIARTVRNVVTVTLPGRRRAVMNVMIQFVPDPVDVLQWNVRFQACRVTVPQSPIDVQIPFGPIGPTGWLRNVYLDENLRITRGHKGSVFVLARPGTTTPQRIAARSGMDI